MLMLGFKANLIVSASSPSRLSWKFDKSLKFTVSNANAKCFASIAFSESLNIIFTYLDSPFSFVESFISLILITPILLYIFPLIKESLALLNPLQIKKITFVSCTIDELINRLSTIKQYL